MKALLYRDTFPRLLADMKGQPWKWLSRLVFLLGPWAAEWSTGAIVLRILLSVVLSQSVCSR